MILTLSIICSILIPIISFLIHVLLKKLVWWLALLISLVEFIIIVGLFCGLILLLLIFLGRHFEKNPDPKDKKRWRFMVDVAKFSCFWLGIRVKINGLEKLNINDTFVFYSNHQSYIDPLIYHNALNKIPHATMYKKVIDSYPLAAPMAKALGGEALDREDDRNAAEVIIKIIRKVKNNINFFIFPEGTRSKGIGLHPYKPGSFKIAKKTSAKTVILALDGSYRKRLTIPFVYTPVYIEVVEVIDSEKLNSMNTTDLATYAQELVKNAQNEIRKNKPFMKPSKKYLKKYQKQKETSDIF